MKIHFVCEGNTYRSRLAEAYFNSRVGTSLTATSSGIRAAENLNGPISWVATLLLVKNHLIPFMANNLWTQTSSEILERNDYIVFLDKPSFDLTRDRLGDIGVPYEIWDIADIEQSRLENDAEVLEIITIASETFKAIQKKVDLLIGERKLS